MPAERSPHADDSLFVRPLVAVTEWTLRAPGTVLVAAIALAVLATVVAAWGLTFKSSRLDLLNPRSEYNRRWLAYLAEFGSRDDAVVVLRGGNPKELAAAIDHVAAELKKQPQYFESVFYRRDLSALKSKALHYLPSSELARFEEQAAQIASLVQRRADPAGPTEQLIALNDRLRHVSAATPAQRVAIDDEYARLAAGLLAGLRPAAGSQAPQGASFDVLRAFDSFNPAYLLADEGRVGFVLLRLVEQTGENAAADAAISRLRDVIQSVRGKHLGVWIGLTGMPVIEHDELQASQIDMLWTSIVSMVLVLLLYLASYGGIRHAMLVNFLLLLGTAYSFGFVTIAVGHLNILSAAFSAVLIGLGIDFSIHYVASYLKLRQEKLGEAEALLRTAAEVGPGVVTGGVTTAAAFFMAAMTDFIGVRELGLVAGGGILLCVLTTVIVLPSLVLLVDRRWPLVHVPAILPVGQWLQWPVQHPRFVAAVFLAATVLLAAGAVRLRYDHNLLNLQPRHLESADIERQLFSQLDDSVWYAVSICRSPEELVQRKAEFETLPCVAKTEEIASLLAAAAPDQSQRVSTLCRILAELPERPLEAKPLNVERLKDELVAAGALIAAEFPYETKASQLLAQVRALVAAAPERQIEAQIAQAQTAAVEQSLRAAGGLRALAEASPPRPADLPRELTDRFVGVSGTHLLKVYARGDIWNMQEMEAFVRAVESVDPLVTGHPVQTYYASRHMQQSFLWAGLYALGAVLILLWLDFRSIAHALLAMVPLAVGFAQMCGIIGWLDLPLNAANMIVLPLILGIGVDHGVHLVHLWRQQRGRFSLGDSTAVAVLLTATTTTASFGALILARHQGLQSLGQVLTLGVTTCLASSIIFFPAVLAWLAPGERGQGSGFRVQGSVERRQEAGDRVQGAEVASQVVAATTEEPRGGGPELDVLGKKFFESADMLRTQYLVPSTLLTAPIPDAGPAPPAIPVPPAPLPPEPIALSPAPVTEEEIAALLDTAYLPHRLRAVAVPQETTDDESEDQEEPGTIAPRRRSRPQRSDAA